MTTLLRIYLPLYLAAYLVMAFVVPTYRIWKRTGINPVTFGKTETAHDYLGRVMKVLLALLFVAVLFFAVGKGLYGYLAPIVYLEKAWLQVAGLILIHLSLLWVCIAQYQMGNSWRIGIDEVNQTDLQTKGVFAISRNPIFWGMIVSVLGLFCILPNALTFFLTEATYLTIQLQIRLEEAFLAQRHGGQYMRYRKATRWLV
jgi:protein-S-isoprenylcysteine O-methyltransferase Ste14